MDGITQYAPGKIWLWRLITYIVTGFLFGVIIYFLPGYSEDEAEFGSWHIPFGVCILIGLGFVLVVYGLYLFIVFLVSLFYKKTVWLLIKALICLTIVAGFYIAFGGMQQNKLRDIMQTLAIAILFFCVPYIENLIRKLFVEQIQPLVVN